MSIACCLLRERQVFDSRLNQCRGLAKMGVKLLAGVAGAPQPPGLGDGCFTVTNRSWLVSDLDTVQEKPMLIELS